MIDGEPWFHATDACHILGLNTNGGTTQHTSKLDAGERRRLTKGLLPQTPSDRAFVGSAGIVVAVSESGLYKLIMRSDKPEAQAFQNWITKVVLPSIRKTGGYLLNEHALALLRSRGIARPPNGRTVQQFLCRPWLYSRCWSSCTRRLARQPYEMEKRRRLPKSLEWHQ